MPIQFDDRFQFLFDKPPVAVLKGSRSSGKSTQAAIYALLACLESREKVLVAREYQSSIRDSSYSLFVELIHKLSMESEFRIYQDSIKSIRTGSTILFKGCKLDPYSIKSTPAISLMILEEAATFSEESLDIILPTLRDEGSRLIVIFNTDSTEDPIYKRFVLNPPPGTIIDHSTYLTNPFVSAKTVADAEHCRITDPDKYKWIFLGEPRQALAAQVFTNWEIGTQNPNVEKGWDVWHGADFSGGSNDPWVLVRCWTRDNILYISDEAVSNSIVLEQVPALFDSIADARKYVIRCDSALPLMISYLKRNGYPLAQGAIKGSGSIEAGIDFMKSYRIIVNPKCKHTIEELKLYSYKKNRVGDILPDIEDKYNHCISKGSLISTERGQIPVEEVAVGDRVWTRKGLKKVVRSGLTGVGRDTISIKTSTGNRLEVTPEHLIWTIDGWKQASELIPTDILLEETFSWSNTQFTTENSIIDIQTVALVDVESVSAGNPSDVYDLSIEDQHEFFANSILVHNCLDGVRYALSSIINGTLQAQKERLSNVKPMYNTDWCP